MSLRMIVVVVLAALYLAGVSDAIDCYVCIGRGGDACSDGSFDASNILVAKMSSCLSCSTRTGGGAFARTCEPSSVATACTESTISGVSTNTCYCNKDNCNAGTGASGAGVPMAAAVTLAVFTLVAKLLM